MIAGLAWGRKVRSVGALTEREAVPGGRRAWRLLVGRPTASRAERYAVAVAASAIAIAIGVALPPDQLAFRILLYIGAAAIATLRGGAAPGLTAVGICAAAFAVGSQRGPTTWFVEPDPVHRWLFFVASAALTVWAGTSLRDGYRHLQFRRRRAEERAYSLRIAADLGVRALAEGSLDALLEDTLAAVRRGLRCDAVTLLQLRPDGTLRLRDAVGLAGALIGKSLDRREAPLAFRALEARTPEVVHDRRSDPDLRSGLLAGTGITSSVLAPIIAPGPGGRSFGVIGAHAVAPSAFGDDAATFLQTAANVVGTAVVRIAAEERARRTIVTERFLAEASRQLALSIDWQQTVTRVARLALPFLGDWCLVVVLDAGRPRSVVAEASEPQRAAAIEELLERYPIDLGAAHGVGRILRTGEPELLREVTAEGFVVETTPEAEIRREVLRRLGVVSYLGAPLTVGGRVLGAIAFGVSEGARRFGPEDLEVAQELAQRCAAALDNASLYRAAQEATRAREQVMAVVSHDLKTPLGALLIGAQVVQRLAPPGVDGDDLRRAASTVRHAAERMQRLIHDLVDMAGIDAGGLSISLAEHDPGAVVREAIEPLRDVALEQGIALEVEVGDVPPVRCDRDRVLQVLANLLSNALHVTQPGGHVRVCVWSTGEEVVFRVVDSGPGIPAGELPRIFERWYRGRAQYPGTGLGLAIARTIVARHGGSIWAESQDGRGASLSFALPTSFGAPGAAG
jgi:signal transduction histidine kinase